MKFRFAWFILLSSLFRCESFLFVSILSISMNPVYQKRRAGNSVVDHWFEGLRVILCTAPVSNVTGHTEDWRSLEDRQSCLAGIWAQEHLESILRLL